MLDPTTLPILLKSLDFLYDEYSKLLTERRERRLAESRAPKADAEEKPATMPPVPTKADALTQKIEPAHWHSREAQIEHLNQLLEIHYGNYHHLSKQRAEWGDTLVPQIIVNSLAHEEKEIKKITQELQEVLAKLYSQDPV